MNHTLPLIAVAALLLAGGCPSDSVSPGGPLEVTRIMPGGAPVGHSGLTSPMRLAIFEAGTFAETWERAFANHDPRPALPQVDFAHEFVVVTAMGEQATGGYAIEVSGAATDDVGAVIGVKLTLPGKGCPVTLATTQPIDIVKVKRPSSGTVRVRFEEQTSSTDCLE